MKMAYFHFMLGLGTLLLLGCLDDVMRGIHRVDCEMHGALWKEYQCQCPCQLYLHRTFKKVSQSKCLRGKNQSDPLKVASLIIDKIEGQDRLFGHELLHTNRITN